MLRDELLLRTRLAPPRLHRRLLPRPALTAKLREALDYRLTLVQAGTGYGKSTALAALAEDSGPILCAWYSIAEADTDPQRFLSYLIAAFRLHLPALSDSPTAILQEIATNGHNDAWPRVVDALVNSLADALDGPALLVLDDELHVHAAKFVVLLVEIHLEAVDHVLADLGEQAGHRRNEAEAQFFRRRGGAETEAQRRAAQQRCNDS